MNLANVSLCCDVDAHGNLDVRQTCNPTDNATFPGTDLPNCSALASDIAQCQAKGKIVTLSLGGATGSVGFASDSQAQTFANTIWNMFLGGSSDTRPFGSAVLDGSICCLFSVVGFFAEVLLASILTLREEARPDTLRL